MLQGHSLTDPLRGTVAHKTSRPDRPCGQEGNPEISMAKQTKPALVAARQARRHDGDARAGEPEPGAVFGEVDTIDEIAPTMLVLLRALPSGTRVYLRVKRTVH